MLIYLLAKSQMRRLICLKSVASWQFSFAQRQENMVNITSKPHSLACFVLFFTTVQKPKGQPHNAVLRGVFFGVQMLTGNQWRDKRAVLAQKYFINVCAYRQTQFWTEPGSLFPPVSSLNTKLSLPAARCSFIFKNIYVQQSYNNLLIKLSTATEQTEMSKYSSNLDDYAFSQETHFTQKYRFEKTIQ